MNTKDIASEYRLAHWSQVMRERVDKGLTIRAYCENNGIHENTYYYWQHKLREAASSGIQTAAAASEEKSLALNGWTALCINEKSPQPQDLIVEISGCRITVSAETDTELLTRICRTLKAL